MQPESIPSMWLCGFTQAEMRRTGCSYLKAVHTACLTWAEQGQEQAKETEQPEQPEQPERLLLVDEVAGLLRINPEMVYELARRGLLPAVPRGKAGRGRAWRPSTVLDYQRTMEGRRT